MATFKFGDVNILDLGFLVANVTVEDPTPNIIKETVPYMNGAYNFTNLYGITTYAERTITIRVINESRGLFDRPSMNEKYSLLYNVLFPKGQNELRIDTWKGYWKGICTGMSSESAWQILGYIDIEFTCYPFRYMEEYEGNDLWDDFNFEYGVAIQTNFEINGTSTIKLYNLGANTVIPEIVTDNNTKFTASTGNKAYTLQTGKCPFVLPPGLTEVTLTGNDTIHFLYRREAL